MGYAFFLNLESGYKRHGSEDERKQKVLVLDAGLYIQEGLEDRRCQIVSLTACMYVFKIKVYVCYMYVCLYGLHFKALGYGRIWKKFRAPLAR